MIIYNVTVGVDKEIEQEWLTWMKGEHIPKVMKSGMFHDSKMYKILGHDDPATSSYSIQYFAESIGNVEEYLASHAPALIREHQLKYKDRHVAFRTLLEEVV